MKDDYKTLELNLISAENLKQVNHLSKMRVYAVVSVSDDPNHPHHQRTDPDRVGGCNPRWNSTFRFDIPTEDPGASLRILLLTERPLGDRDVGRVAVPIRELLAGGRDDGAVESVGLRVRDSRSNETDGVVNFSYRILPSTGPPAAVLPPESWTPPRGRDNKQLFWGTLLLGALISGLGGSPL